jgi:hypothetical protein
MRPHEMSDNGLAYKSFFGNNNLDFLKYNRSETLLRAQVEGSKKYGFFKHLTRSRLNVSISRNL